MTRQFDAIGADDMRIAGAGKGIAVSILAAGDVGRGQHPDIPADHFLFGKAEKFLCPVAERPDDAVLVHHDHGQRGTVSSIWRRIAGVARSVEPASPAVAGAVMPPCWAEDPFPTLFTTPVRIGAPCIKIATKRFKTTALSDFSGAQQHRVHFTGC